MKNSSNQQKKKHSVKTRRAKPGGNVEIPTQIDDAPSKIDADLSRPELDVATPSVLLDRRRSASPFCYIGMNYRTLSIFFGFFSIVFLLHRVASLDAPFSFCCHRRNSESQTGRKVANKMSKIRLSEEFFRFLLGICSL